MNTILLNRRTDSNKTETKIHARCIEGERSEIQRRTRQSERIEGRHGRTRQSTTQRESTSCVANRNPDEKRKHFFTIFIRNSTVVMQNIFPFGFITISRVMQHELAGHLTSEMLARQNEHNRLSQKKKRRSEEDHIDPCERKSSIQPGFLVIQTSDSDIRHSASSKYPSDRQTPDSGIRSLHDLFRSSLPAAKNYHLPYFKVELYFGFVYEYFIYS